MTKKCGICGSTERVQYVFDSFCESGEWRCTSCLGRRFPEGSRIVKFTDRSNPQHPSYYMCVQTQEDLDLVMTVGERAHRLGAKGMEACFYTSLIEGRPVGPQSFSLGHSDSESRLRSFVDSLRMHLETSEKLRQVKDEQVPRIIWSTMAPAATAR